MTSGALWSMGCPIKLGMTARGPGGTGQDRAGPGTTAGHRVRRFRAISATSFGGLVSECSVPASEVAARGERQGEVDPSLCSG